MLYAIYYILNAIYYTQIQGNAGGTHTDHIIF